MQERKPEFSPTFFADRQLAGLSVFSDQLPGAEEVRNMISRQLGAPGVAMGKPWDFMVEASKLDKAGFTPAQFQAFKNKFGEKNEINLHDEDQRKLMAANSFDESVRDIVQIIWMEFFFKDHTKRTEKLLSLETLIKGLNEVKVETANKEELEQQLTDWKALLIYAQAKLKEISGKISLLEHENPPPRTGEVARQLLALESQKNKILGKGTIRENGLDSLLLKINTLLHNLNPALGPIEELRKFVEKNRKSSNALDTHRVGLAQQTLTEFRVLQDKLKSIKLSQSQKYQLLEDFHETVKSRRATDKQAQQANRFEIRARASSVTEMNSLDRLLEPLEAALKAQLAQKTQHTAPKVGELKEGEEEEAESGPTHTRQRSTMEASQVAQLPKSSKSSKFGM